jgi:hypothetical protein
MNAQEKRTTNRCNKLHELPPVVTDGQQTAWCPDCEYVRETQFPRALAKEVAP